MKSPPPVLIISKSVLVSCSQPGREKAMEVFGGSEKRRKKGLQIEELFLPWYIISQWVRAPHWRLNSAGPSEEAPALSSESGGRGIFGHRFCCGFIFIPRHVRRPWTWHRKLMDQGPCLSLVFSARAPVKMQITEASSKHRNVFHYNPRKFSASAFY